MNVEAGQKEMVGNYEKWSSEAGEVAKKINQEYSQTSQHILHQVDIVKHSLQQKRTAVQLFSCSAALKWCENEHTKYVWDLFLSFGMTFLIIWYFDPKVYKRVKICPGHCSRVSSLWSVDVLIWDSQTQISPLAHLVSNYFCELDTWPFVSLSLLWFHIVLLCYCFIYLFHFLARIHIASYTVLMIPKSTFNFLHSS